MQLYRGILDEQLEIMLREEVGDKGLLVEACSYALQGGKRIRGSIVLAIYHKQHNGVDWIEGIINPAMAVECLHAASLVVDDLPCMDNDDYRRGKLSVHKKFGEDVAILVTNSLAALSFRLLEKQIDLMVKGSDDLTQQNSSFRKGAILFRRLAIIMGPQGLCGGEIREILAKRERSKPTDTSIRDVINEKTTSLFGVAFSFGYEFSDLSERGDEIEKISREFGFLFQVYDDILDQEKDREVSVKHNYALFYGTKKAVSDLQQSIDRFYQRSIELGIWCPYFSQIIQLIITKINENLRASNKT